MSLYIDRKFLLLISNHLRNFKQKKQDLFCFSCPICGDSKKNTLKARGYVYEKRNKLFYICHNCGISTTFSNLLKHVDSANHKQYVMEKFTNRNKKEPITNTTKKLVDIQPIQKVNTDLPSIEKLEDAHYAKQYVIGRKIPKDRWNEIFYCDDFKKFMDQKYPGHEKKLPDNDSRLVLFFTDENGTITHVASRSLTPETKMRYITIKVVPEADKKIYGLQKIDVNKTIYVLEGQFDSMFVDNSVASGDSSLASLSDYLKNTFKTKEIVLIYDNEKRNKDIVRQMGEAIDRGHRLVFWPDDIQGKDINDMVKDYGYTKEKIMEIIQKNTMKGLLAELRFANWKKC
jgi:hypothetical protein